MKGEHVRSDDPFKKIITMAFKQAYGANKITLVRDVGGGYYEANCLKGGRSGYQNLGRFRMHITPNGTATVCGFVRRERAHE